MKANLKLVLEIDGRRFELTPEEAAELARKLGELCGQPREQGYPIWPTWPPYWWHRTWTGTGVNADDPTPPGTKVWITGDTTDGCLIPQIQEL